MSLSTAAGSQDGILLRTHCAGVAPLTLNRPQQMNALSMDLLDALQSALNDVAADPAIRVVVIAANGKAFCRGLPVGRRVRSRGGVARSARPSGQRSLRPLAIQTVRGISGRQKVFYRQSEMDMASAYKLACGVITDNMLGQHALEGVTAFVEKRKPEWHDN